MGEITQAKTIRDKGLSLDKVGGEREIALGQGFGPNNKALNPRVKHLVLFQWAMGRDVKGFGCKRR